MDDPILPFLSSLPSLPDVVLPFFSTTIDLTFDGLDVDAGDFAATWLRREAEAADSAEASASASSSRGAAAPQRAPRVRSSGHRVHAPLQHHHRSRSPPIFFPGRMESCGQFMRDALVGSAWRHGLALWTLPGDMPYAAVEQACRRRILSVIRNDLTFYFGISENPQRRWAEHSESCGNWQEMIVLVEADSSVRTAGLERTFIKEFGERLACLNIGPGGERASSSSPHYFYMLVGINGLLRRRGRG